MVMRSTIVDFKISIILQETTGSPLTVAAW